jgi:hypothetical protein
VAAIRLPRVRETMVTAELLGMRKAIVAVELPGEAMMTVLELLEVRKITANTRHALGCSAQRMLTVPP